MFRSLFLPASFRPRRTLAALLIAFNLAACSSDPPPDMNDVKKMVQEDRTFEALKTLIPLATDGDPQAQYELAGFYHYGYVGANDYAKALKWYRASARQGYADAMVGLSVMYLGGQGVAKDRREAFVWLSLAAQYMKDEKALAKVKKVRDDVGRGLTPDDIAYAKAESLLLAPETSSVQPNEAESIDHLPDALPEPAATVGVEPLQPEPLQNVPPETAPLTTAPATVTPPLPDMQLQPALPAAPRPVTTLPATTTPSSTTAPVSTQPVAPKLPSTTLPVTTPGTIPPQVTPSPTPPVLPPADPVDPVPTF